MRQAGTIDSEANARKFISYLLTQGITGKADRSGDAWAIWVHDENQLARSKQELEKFLAQPDDPLYASAEQEAERVRRETAEKLREAKKNYIDLRNQWSNPAYGRPVTMILIVLSVAEFFCNELNWYDARQWLWFSWPEIMQGQVWRLVTPIFVHLGILHIVFNMWWLTDLGALAERQLRSFWFLLLVLAIAITSNAAQYWAHGSAFGGMSGVVYGLFGYCWVRGRLEPASGLYLRPDVAFWMIAWLFYCMSPYTPVPIANWAHGVGLVVGMAFGCTPLVRRWLR